jgi:hypothetical protein
LIETGEFMEKYLDGLILCASIAGIMWIMLKFMLKDIHRDLTDIREDIKELKDANNRSEKRIDHLYQICIEMLGTKHKN